MQYLKRRCRKCENFTRVYFGNELSFHTTYCITQVRNLKLETDESVNVAFLNSSVQGT